MLTTSKFLRLAKSFRRIPLWKSLDGLPVDPVSLCARLSSKNSWGFLLDSGALTAQGRYIYFSASPPHQTVELIQDMVVLSSDLRKKKPLLGSPLECLREFLEDPHPVQEEDLPPFWGGAVGYLGYDLAARLEPGLRGLTPKSDPLDLPHMAFGFYDEVVALDLQEKRTILMICMRWEESRDQALRRLGLLEQRVKSVWDEACNAKSSSREFKSQRVKIVPDEVGFIQIVEQAKRSIGRGDIYQANLSLRFSGSFEGDLWQLHRHLRSLNPSPYACLLWFPNFSVLSTSPELLLRVRGTRVVTRPIAGTRPRGSSPLEDRQMEGELLLSPKERAEHIMLVDLERNDLGRICSSGSVHVSERMVVERYSHVMHIVSQVEGRFAPGRHPFEAIEAVFPGGTISGCPKIRAIQIIRELEPLARGLFFGSAGWLGYSGDLELNILIRTLVLKGGTATVQAGAGIVADSDPQSEYLESLQKARVLLEALQNPSPAARERVGVRVEK